MRGHLGTAGALLSTLFFCTPATAGEIYRYVDAQGVTHFTDRPEAVPGGTPAATLPAVSVLPRVDRDAAHTERWLEDRQTQRAARGLEKARWVNVLSQAAVEITTAAQQVEQLREAVAAEDARQLAALRIQQLAAQRQAHQTGAACQLPAAPVVLPQSDALRARLADAEAAHVAAQANYAALVERARRAGVPKGWVYDAERIARQS